MDVIVARSVRVQHRSESLFSFSSRVCVQTRRDETGGEDANQLGIRRMSEIWISARRERSWSAKDLGSFSSDQCRRRRRKDQCACSERWMKTFLLSYVKLEKKCLLRVSREETKQRRRLLFFPFLGERIEAVSELPLLQQSKAKASRGRRSSRLNPSFLRISREENVVVVVVDAGQRDVRKDSNDLRDLFDSNALSSRSVE